MVKPMKILSGIGGRATTGKSPAGHAGKHSKQASGSPNLATHSKSLAYIAEQKYTAARSRAGWAKYMETLPEGDEDETPSGSANGLTPAHSTSLSRQQSTATGKSAAAATKPIKLPMKRAGSRGSKLSRNDSGSASKELGVEVHSGSKKGCKLKGLLLGGVLAKICTRSKHQHTHK